MVFQNTNDTNIGGYVKLVSPVLLKAELSISERVSEVVFFARETIAKILSGEGKRLLVIAGPCSIHDEEAALDYARRLNNLRQKVAETQFLVMRVYFEKPRTTVGWKGLIHDPDLDNSCDMEAGFRQARQILLAINEMGLPVATEMLDPITPQYIADLVSWTAIGARTTESQTHREMASGLSMPVGFKNCTDGGIDNAVNAILAARVSQSFLGIDPEGLTSVVSTKGNPHGHLVLRGGKRPNYDSVSVAEAVSALKAKDLPPVVMVDCSHGNSRKRHEGQTVAWHDVINQRLDGNTAIIGLMLESNLSAGNQPINGDRTKLQYGVSVTDECISWETTEDLLLAAHEKLLSSGTKEKVGLTALDLSAPPGYRGASEPGSSAWFTL